MTKHDLQIEDAVNTHCPWSGKLVAEDSLMQYQGVTIGFCNPGCRDKFAVATEMFDALIDANAD